MPTAAFSNVPRNRSSLARNCSFRPGALGAISCSNSFRAAHGQRWRGTIGTRAITVTQEATAVNNLITPAKRYAGHQKITASIRCVVPHARMKVTNSQKIVGNGTSFSDARRSSRARRGWPGSERTKLPGPRGCATSRAPASMSRSASRGGKPDVSNTRCSKNPLLSLPPAEPSFQLRATTRPEQLLRGAAGGQVPDTNKHARRASRNERAGRLGDRASPPAPVAVHVGRTSSRDGSLPGHPGKSLTTLMIVHPLESDHETPCRSVLMQLPSPSGAAIRRPVEALGVSIARDPR